MGLTKARTAATSVAILLGSILVVDLWEEPVWGPDDDPMAYYQMKWAGRTARWKNWLRREQEASLRWKEWSQLRSDEQARRGHVTLQSRRSDGTQRQTQKTEPPRSSSSDVLRSLDGAAPVLSLGGCSVFSVVVGCVLCVLLTCCAGFGLYSACNRLMRRKGWAQQTGGAEDRSELSVEDSNLPGDVREALSEHRRSLAPMEVFVRREMVYEDSIALLNNLPPNGWGRPKVHFEGEAGVDCGGPRREWYRLLLEEIFDDRKPYFRRQASELLWFNPAAELVDPNYAMHMRFLGCVCGSAILEGVAVDIPMPDLLFKQGDPDARCGQCFSL